MQILSHNINCLYIIYTSYTYTRSYKSSAIAIRLYHIVETHNGSYHSIGLRCLHLLYPFFYLTIKLYNFWISYDLRCVYGIN